MHYLIKKRPSKIQFLERINKINRIVTIKEERNSSYPHQVQEINIDAKIQSQSRIV